MMIESTAGSWDSIWNTYNKRTYDYQLAVEEYSVRWQGIERIVMQRFGSFEGLNTIEIGEDGHSGILIPVDVVEACVHVLVRMASDEGYRHATGRRGRRRVETHFSIRKNVEAIQTIYADLLIGPMRGCDD